MIFVLGGGGFVGQAYGRLFTDLGIEHVLIRRDNYQEYVGQSCDVLINANGNSKKFLSDRDPVWDFDASVTSVVRSLEDFKAERYVMLSSGDVYPDQSSPAVTQETAVVDSRASSRYGLHKLIAETMVLSVHPRPLVMRMGGFVGPGMKKNAIFDLLNNQTVWLQPESQLQFISTDRAARLVWGLAERGVTNEIVNLGATGTVRIGDLFKRIGSRSEFAPEARLVRFELAIDKLRALSNGEVPSSQDEVEAFLQSINR